MIVDYDVEINVLAGMLKDEKSLYEGLSLLTEQHFNGDQHKEVFREIQRLSSNGQVTYNMVYKALRETVHMDLFKALRQSIVSADSFPYWYKQLHEIYVKRLYFEAAQEISEIANSNRPLSEITEIVESKIMGASVQEGTERIVTPEEAGRKAAEEFERRVKSGETIHGIKLSRPVPSGGMPVTDGFPGLDDMFRGLRGGDLIILAAKTGEGKTTLAQNIVRHASIHQSYRTFYQNTEMKEIDIVNRFVAQMTGKSYAGIDSGSLDSFDRTLVRQAFENYAKSRVFISELPMLTPERSRGLARQFKTKYGKLDLLVIDYVGRMELDNSKGKQEWQILRDIAKECKRLAQQLDTCVILVAQLNEEGKLQGARAMANEADGVLFLEPLTREEVNNAPYGATHKLEPYKARRGSKDKHLWISFNKAKMYITEVRG
ncbi:replicative DNA helicase [Paenibacillus senegalensis]|uniref:replicative DNA helicase n=1 Tax=Paenibacillus senegalensis TaxID=1465766 RepID=UPI000287F184|nr:DnaB-like helicase C-terminal domain-containing protein [Paenibacillus senegalensis]